MASMAYVARDRSIDFDPIIDYCEAIEKAIAEAKRIENEEKVANETLRFSYQNWTHNNVFGSLNYSIGRVDGGEVTAKRISELKNTLMYQKNSFKRFSVYMTLSYSNLTGGQSERAARTEITLNVGEGRFKFEYDVPPEEAALCQATTEFVNKIDNMPLKLDRIIKQKELVIMKTGFAMGMFPALVLGAASLFVPPLAQFYRQYFFVFPCLVLALGFIIGIFLGGMRLSSSYAKLIPTKYGGYNTKTRSSYRVDDMDSFNEEVDVYIGKKSDFGTTRQFIENTEKKMARFILPELGAALILTGIAALVLFVFGGK